MNAYQRLLEDLGELWKLHPHDLDQFVAKAVAQVKKHEPMVFSARDAVRTAMCRGAASKLTAAEIKKKLFSGANDLYTARGEMRKLGDILQDAHDDASGAVTEGMYQDAGVKKTKDAMYHLDHEMGNVAREMENLARSLK